jgi:hypothetical protein
MSGKAKKIHHEARRIGGDEEWAWSVSDCYYSDFQLEMTTDWDQVTCANCLKARKPAAEPSTARPVLGPE